MSQESCPAFQFYVKEWRSSRSVMRMSFAERGMYLEMLLEQWENYGVPDDPEAVAELLGGTVAEWTAAWPALRRKFVDRRMDPRDENQPARTKIIVNLKLEQVRGQLKKFIRGARKGGVSRSTAAKRGDDGTYLSSAGPAPNPAPPPAPSPAPHPGGLQAASSTPTPTPTPIPTATAVRERAPESEANFKKTRSGHAWENADGAYHVPFQLHVRFIKGVSRKYQEDAFKADKRLRTWYAAVCSRLQPRDVMGEAFKFWQSQFDSMFATPATGPPPWRANDPKFVTPGYEETQRKYLSQMPKS